jgi:hypothetical protein
VRRCAAVAGAFVALVSSLAGCAQVAAVAPSAGGLLGPKYPNAAKQSPNDFFRSIARAAPRGTHPRYFLDEQTTWTAIGPDGGPRQALLSSDGLLEVDQRSFSVEPFLRVDGRLVTWADVASTASLAEGALPIPTVEWRTADGIALTSTVFATQDGVLWARYALGNRGTAARDVELWLALRPFQVNPPWQSLNGAGGVSPIHHLAREDRAVWVNGAKAVAWLPEPDAFGAARFDQGEVAKHLAAGRVPPERRVFDAAGFASGASLHRFTLAPGASAEVSLAIPFGDPRPFFASLPREADAPAYVAAALAATQRHWHVRLARFEIQLPPVAGDLVASLRAALGQILVARDGPMLRPGTRTYGRAWIRDGVLMASALLEHGLADEARDFLRWYAPYQAPDGRVPCCVDWRGADPVPEHDSPGQLLYGIVSLHRYERDVRFVAELWPRIERAVAFVESLRAQRLGPAYESGDAQRFLGLLPESISHEGYAKRPVHSYWDDAWALRGLRDAVLAAELLGKRAHAARWSALAGAFERDLAASIEATMRHFALDTIPASADLGDFDPSATAIFLAPGLARSVLPANALARTYQRYVEDVRGRRGGRIAWDAYTPYELRNVEALVQLGRRDDALYLLTGLLGDQRPPGWRQWGEIVWRDPAAPNFVGDLPHAWIAAGHVRAVRSLFVFEREDDTLVLGAGVPLAWIEQEPGVRVAGLRTHYGPLAYSMRAAGPRRIEVAIEPGLEIPRGGIVIEPPVAIRAATLDGAPVQRSLRGIVVHALPARILIEYGVGAQESD